ncbi:DUF3137 domain-containing protein [Clostridia bacterium OttesenSCG-928-F22]|nr:DUF3137 domain-containing protein [Clostridia bacterium OttesenSCG-928-F22]
MHENTAQPAYSIEATFAQMDRLFKKARAIRRVSWVSFLLYPVFMFAPDLLEIDIGAGGALGTILYGAIVMLGPIICFAIFRKWARRVERKYHGYSAFFKSIVVKTELNNAFANPAFSAPNFEPDKGWPIQFIQSFGLFKGFNIYESNDWLTGRYNNLPFEQADINLIDEHTERYWDSDDKTYRTRTVRTPIFRGRLLRLAFEEEFPTDLLIISSNIAGIAYSSSSTTTVMGKTTVKSAAMTGWDAIETESVDFNKAFHSFAIDPSLAMLMMKPQTILTILDIQNSFGMSLVFYFRNNELFVFQQTGGMTFEISSRENVEKQKSKAKEDAGVIVRFLEIMGNLAQGFINSSIMRPAGTRSERNETGTTRVMTPHDADLSFAPNIIIEGHPANLGGWKADNVVAFRFNVSKAGRYRITLHYSKDKKLGDPSDVLIAATNTSIAVPLPATGGGWAFYSEQSVGELELPLGEAILSIASSNPHGNKNKYVMNLRSIRLTLID